MDIPSSIKSLCELNNPYVSGKKYEQMFVSAMKDAVTWHREGCEYFSKLLENFNIDENSIETIEDCSKLPLIHANFFKTHKIKSIEDKDIEITLTSSGTTGQKSQMFFDKWSIDAGRRMIEYIFDFYNWNKPDQEVNYLLYTYETLPDSTLGTAATDNFLLKFAKPVNIFYALKLTDLENVAHEFDAFGTIEKLYEYEKQGLPVRIFGFPSFMYFTLKRMASLKLKPIKLNPESLTSFGGGWKGFANQQIPKLELYKMIEFWLGIPEERCRDGYGSVEHSVPYFECPNHNLHIPVWSRAFIRNVKTLEVTGYNNPGFLHFVTPYITSVPAISVMMGDLAVLHSPEECGCGLDTPFIEIIGRAGTSAAKSCAITASELLKRSKV
jgi:phenylacetate-coenzyme A ligase PaaK-like adenylate-forming protein